MKYLAAVRVRHPSCWQRCQPYRVLLARVLARSVRARELASAAREQTRIHNRVLSQVHKLIARCFGRQPLPGRVVDDLERLAVLVEPAAPLLVPAAACGRAPSRALFPPEMLNESRSRRLEVLDLLSQRISLALRSVALGGERRMRRRLAQQVSPPRLGHEHNGRDSVYS